MAVAMIWAAGSGTRLRNSEDPVLASTPKMIVPVYTDQGAMPLVAYQLGGLRSVGFDDFVLLTREASDTGFQEIEDIGHRMLDDRVSIFREQGPRLGTGGILRKACDITQQQTVLVITGDMLIPFEHFPRAVALHEATKAQITSVVTSRPEPDAYNEGRILIDAGNDKVAADPYDGGSLESSTQFRATSAGAMVLDAEWFKSAFDLFQHQTGIGPEVDFHRQFISWLLFNDKPIRYYDLGEPAPDLGEPERYMRHRRVSSSSAVRSPQLTDGLGVPFGREFTQE